MEKIYTENSPALLQLLEERSSVLWNNGDKPTEYSDEGEILFLMPTKDGLICDNKDTIEDEKYLTPEAFIAECVKRFPKAESRKSAAEILGEIERLVGQLKEVL